ncbi:hypothetical protein HGRIS_008701 [Hohenbuehelia grisea]|uniref:polynucleotide adenylyltransferase n=1 Tax=Hohenbuehelia grisea TaxID=104357 RepID=A0ABR3J8T3_9AGAR
MASEPLIYRLGDHTISPAVVQSIPQRAGLSRPNKRKREDDSDSTRNPRFCLSPWLGILLSRKYTSLEQRLHYEIAAYVQWIQPTPQEISARQLAFGAIEQAVYSQMPHCELKVQGSVATGLCLPSSDIDLVVCTRQEYTREEVRRMLRRLSYALKGAGVASDVRVISGARIPIIAFKTPQNLGSFSVDIGLNNTDGLLAIGRIKEYLSNMPALLPLILVIKGLLAMYELNTPANGGLGSYAVILMVIHHLQANINRRTIDKLQNPTQSESLGALLMDFLDYYGTKFPYEESYISVTEAKLLPKSSANWIQQRNLKNLSIECLIRPKNDASSAATRIQEVKAAFQGAYLDLLSLNAEDGNVLGTVVSVSQEFVDYRARVAYAVDAQTTRHAMPPQFHPQDYSYQSHHPVYASSSQDDRRHAYEPSYRSNDQRPYDTPSYSRGPQEYSGYDPHGPRYMNNRNYQAYDSRHGGPMRSEYGRDSHHRNGDHYSNPQRGSSRRR